MTRLQQTLLSRATERHQALNFSENMIHHPTIVLLSMVRMLTL
jgi:hypothetical protein